MTRMSTSVTKFAIGAVVLVALATGCGTKTATKAGKTANPIVLRAAANSSTPSTDPQMDYFARRVLELSHGALQIKVDDSLDDGTPRNEQGFVREVANGTADIGWIRTRVLDSLGVTSFRALTAPMLVDTYPLEGAVIASDIPSQMLPALSKLKVTGLALLASAMRKPVAVKRPLLGPADWHGLGFGTIVSSARFDAIRAVGASPIPTSVTGLEAQVSSGEVQAAEKALSIYAYGGLDALFPYVTANVNLWPDVIALFVNPRRFEKLTSDQQKWLRQAASDAATQSAKLVDQDASFVEALCKPQRAHFANASTAELGALRAAFAPAIARLERDPRTKSFIERITQLKRSLPAVPPLTIPARCTASTTKATSSAPTDPSVLDGTYRVSQTEKELVESGAPAEHAKGNYGVSTLRLANGKYRYKNSRAPWECAGSYSVSGSRVTVDFNVPHCHGAVRMRWILRPDALLFRDVVESDKGDAAFFGSKPWKKIG